MKKISTLKYILIGLTFISAVKMIFFGWVIDEGYAFAIGNRLLQGDLLFKDMWELHQTSGYAIEFLLGIYRFLVRSGEGEVVFVRAVGMIIHLAVSYALYRALKRHMSDEKAFIAAVLYANLTPKSICIPEFSNLINQTSVLTLICLDRLYLEKSAEDKKKRYMTAFAAGVFLSLCVMSYPPSVIFAVFVFVYVLLKSKGKRGEFITMLSVCLISGALYIVRIFSYMSAGELGDSVRMMLSSDSTHGGGLSKITGYASDTLILVIFIVVFGAAAFLISKLLGRKELFLPLVFIMVFGWRVLHILLKNDTYPVEYTFGCILIVSVLVLIYEIKAGAYSAEDKNLLKLYVGGSLGVFLTVLAACNQSVFSSAKYLTVLFAVTAALSYKEKSRDGNFRILFAAGVMAVILINIFQYANPRNRLLNIFDAEARVPSGPQAGLILERMYANKARIDNQELSEILNSADYVMITGDAITYLYTDARIGHGTTIMTEDYGENYALYWEARPDRKPDMIAVECYEGSLDAVVASSWLIDYLENEYGASEVVDTTYYRIYIK
ncbi:MAG: glycosyltransferase family 39 protein [Lachnospiraceae bacterium]|nr:glycosyltransferase family 39 protein [Lachnospiraceae bacterium]